MSKQLLVVVMALGLVSACASEEERGMASGSSAAMTPEAVNMEVVMERDALQRSLGERHRELETLVGDWTVTTVYSEAIGAPDDVADAKAEMVLNGRFLKTTMSGTMMGAPITSIGYRAYDSLTLEHVHVSMNDHYTGPYEMRGHEIGGDQIEYHGIMRDSMSPEGRPYRAVERKIDDDTFEVIVYDSQAGAEFLVMTMTWNRK